MLKCIQYSENSGYITIFRIHYYIQNSFIFSNNCSIFKIFYIFPAIQTIWNILNCIIYFEYSVNSKYSENSIIDKIYQFPKMSNFTNCQNLPEMVKFTDDASDDQLLHFVSCILYTQKNIKKCQNLPSNLQNYKNKPASKTSQNHCNFNGFSRLYFTF